MKRQHVKKIRLALLAAVVAQFLSSPAFAAPWNANGTYQYMQGNGGGGTFDLKQTGTQITGSATTNIQQGPAPGAIVGGRIDGDQISLTVNYPRATNVVNGTTNVLWEGGQFQYNGTINNAGVVVGDMYDVLRPQNTFKFAFTSAFPVAQKAVKSFGRNKPPALSGVNTFTDMGSGNFARTFKDGKTGSGIGTINGSQNVATPFKNGNTGITGAGMNSAVQKLFQTSSTPVATSDGAMQPGGAGTMNSAISTMSQMMGGTTGGINNGAVTQTRQAQDILTQMMGGTPAATNATPSNAEAEAAAIRARMEQTRQMRDMMNKNAIANGTMPSYAGTWEAFSTTGDRFTLVLTQNGTEVTGTISPKNGTFRGQVEHNGSMMANFRLDDGTSGNLYTSLHAGGKTFSGPYAEPKSSGPVGSWSAVRR